MGFYCSGFLAIHTVSQAGVAFWLKGEGVTFNSGDSGTFDQLDTSGILVLFSMTGSMA